MKLVLRHLTKNETAKLLFFILVTLGTVLVFTLTPSLFPSALISILFFFVFTPIIDAVERKGISRTIGILVLLVVCALGITIAARWITPRITQEVVSFQQGSSRFSGDIAAKLHEQEARLVGQFPFLKGSVLTDKTIKWMTHSLERVWESIPNVASNLLMCLFLVPFFTFILLKDAHEIRRQLLKLVPNRHFETVYSLFARILDQMGGYVAARILEAVIVFLMVTIGCAALKIPYAIMLGFFAGATNAIPYIGPLIGAVPGLVLAVLEPSVPNQLAYVLSIYLAANVIDTILIFPLVVAKIVDLHPVIVVISVILGSQVFGIVGMLVAVPVMTILKILTQELYSRVYHDHDILG